MSILNSREVALLITFLKRQCSGKNCSLITSASITIISAWKTTIFLKILRICIFMILVKLYIILLDNQKLHKITEFVYFCTFSTGKINLLFKQFFDPTHFTLAGWLLHLKNLGLHIFEFIFTF